MNQYKYAVIVPVIYLTDYSRKAMRNIADKAGVYPHVQYIISCAEDLTEELKSIFLENNNRSNIVIAPSKVVSSNHLRHHGVGYVESDYVYYQDCDDEVDYQIVLDHMIHCTGDNVVCFNIRRRQFDEEGNVIDDRTLYPQTGFEVRRINQLMTNIVNKLIPKKYLQVVSFYNIPFSQDLSLSFQLFEKGPHLYLSDSAYLYENNYKSTAGLKKTKRESLLRVVAVERILLKLLENKSNQAFVKYRYEVMIQGRFAYLKECYCPAFSFRAISPFRFGIRGLIGHLYHYIRSYVSCVYIKMLTMKQ